MGTTLLVAGALGCAGVESTAAVDTSRPVPTVPSIDTDDAGMWDAPPPPPPRAAPVFGSPLCNASLSSCYPDDPTTVHAKWCSAPDGGFYSAPAGYDNAPLACHVQAMFNTTVQPGCTLAGTLTDMSTTPCHAPSDCAPGFECVERGSCRHYCCAGACFDPDEFCDIQQTAAAPPIKVPVCMPIHGCGLLDQPSDAGACPLDQTCAVVRVENGATSCVAIGSKNAGEECDTDHCAGGLVCLGTTGDRHCYKLCHTAPGSTDCTAGKQTCKGGLPLFPLPGVGICQ
jgi:hypothetical protein